MAEQRFDAQALTQSGNRGEHFEMTFVDQDGNRLTVSLPRMIAGEIVAPILDALKGAVPMREALKIVRQSAVGRANDEPLVLLRVNDEAPLAFALPDAKRIWRELREECDAVERRPGRRPT